MDTGTIILILSFGIPLVVIVLIIAVIKRSFAKRKRWADELKLKQANANPAAAKVISASQGLHGGSIRRLIFLKLLVSDGFTEPYEAEAAWFVETLHFNKIQEGNAIMVKVDRDNPKTIYPAESWAVYTEGYDRNLSLDKFKEG
jgi:hypothetical protein